MQNVPWACQQVLWGEGSRGGVVLCSSVLSVFVCVVAQGRSLLPTSQIRHACIRLFVVSPAVACMCG
jgi:hypothetical protein